MKSQVEIRMFDVILEQKKITTENNGSTELLKLLGKAWELNLPLPGKGKKPAGGPGSGVRPGHVDLSEGLHVDADSTDPVTLAAEKEQAALAARMKVQIEQSRLLVVLCLTFVGSCVGIRASISSLVYLNFS